jgi:hypothetical protein
MVKSQVPGLSAEGTELAIQTLTGTQQVNTDTPTKNNTQQIMASQKGGLLCCFILSCTGYHSVACQWRFSLHE